MEATLLDGCPELLAGLPGLLASVPGMLKGYPTLVAVALGKERSGRMG